ncbi:hypothetical protein ACKFKG_02795 [Phormidesmis sp. 146-35]
MTKSFSILVSESVYLVADRAIVLLNRTNDGLNHAIVGLWVRRSGRQGDRFGMSGQTACSLIARS